MRFEWPWQTDCAVIGILFVLLQCIRHSIAVDQSVYTTTVGRSVMLPCFTQDDSTVTWSFLVDDKQRNVDSIFIGGKMSDGWIGKATVEPIATGDHSLIIHRPEINDGGTYVCTEGESRLEHRHRLNVVADNDTVISISVTNGLPVAFNCFLMNATRVRWYSTPLDGKPMVLYNGYRNNPNHSHSARSIVYRDATVHRSVLYINSTMPSDAGNFTCSPSTTMIVKEEFQLIVREDTCRCNILKASGECSTISWILQSVTGRSSSTIDRWMILSVILAVCFASALVACMGLLYRVRASKRTKTSRQVDENRNDEENNEMHETTTLNS